MITLIGHGYIGSSLAKGLSNFNWITHKDEVPQNTTFIINATGYVGSPNADEIEKRKNFCIEANVLFPMRLEQTTKVPIIHITSGCVYDGYKDGGWLETDESNLNYDNGSFYGGSKALLEKLMTPYLNKSYLFRIRLPFGKDKHRKNLLCKLNKYEKLVNYQNSITCMEDLIVIVNYFIKNRPESGIYNVTNPGSITTKEIANMLKLDKEWFSEEEYKKTILAPRSNCTLNTKKLESVFSIMPIERAIDLTIAEYSKSI